MEFVREFVAGAIDAAGGIAEEAASSLHVLLPAAEAARIGIAEDVGVAFGGAHAGDQSVVDGRLGSPLIEHLVGERLAAPAVTAVALPPELPRALPEAVPVLLNAVRRGEADSLRAPARYAVVVVRALLQGDEVRSALESVCIRLSDGARVTIPPFERGDPISLPPIEQRERQLIGDVLARWVRCEALALLSGALESVKRRARRDLERMVEYYASLDADMARAAKRARSAEERARRIAKRAGLPADLAARRAQVCARLAPRLSASIIAMTLVDTDVERFDVPVRRRVRNGSIDIRCRAADSTFEGPACAVCGTATLRFYLCDEKLHVLCDRCGRHGRLDRARCRACTAQPPEPLILKIEDPTARIELGA